MRIIVELRDESYIRTKVHNKKFTEFLSEYPVTWRPTKTSSYLPVTDFSSGTALIPPLDEVVLDKVHDEGDGEKEGGDQGGPVYRHPHQLNKSQIDWNKKPKPIIKRYKDSKNG